MYKKPYYIYMIEGRDQMIYTGMTNSIRRRLNEHNGVGFWNNLRSWTTKQRPVFLLHLEKWPDKKSARKRELEIKKLSHQAKLDLITNTSKDNILSAI